MRNCFIVTICLNMFLIGAFAFGQSVQTFSLPQSEVGCYNPTVDEDVESDCSSFDETKGLYFQYEAPEKGFLAVIVRQGRYQLDELDISDLLFAELPPLLEDLEDLNDVDNAVINSLALEESSKLSLELEARRDLVIDLYDLNGKHFDSYDIEAGSQEAGLFLIPQEGTYYVSITQYNGENIEQVMDVTSAWVAFPNAIVTKDSSSFGTSALDLTVNTKVTGVLSDDNLEDVYVIENHNLPIGSKVIIETESDKDIVLSAYVKFDVSSEIQSDNDFEGNPGDERLLFDLQSQQPIYISVRLHPLDEGGPAGTYTLEVNSLTAQPLAAQ